MVKLIFSADAKSTSGICFSLRKSGDIGCLNFSKRVGFCNRESNNDQGVIQDASEPDYEKSKIDVIQNQDSYSHEPTREPLVHAAGAYTSSSQVEKAPTRAKSEKDHWNHGHCKICQFDFENTINLSRHQNTSHSFGPSYSCKYSAFRYRSKSKGVVSTVPTLNSWR